MLCDGSVDSENQSVGSGNLKIQDTTYSIQLKQSIYF